MAREVQASYEDGVLRPMVPLSLEEHQLVNVIVLDVKPSEDELTFIDPRRFEPLADHRVTAEMVRQALSNVHGSLDEDFSAERNEQ